MKKRILPIILSTLFFANLSYAQGTCGSYKGYLQDDIKKHPEFYQNLQQQNAELEKANEGFLKNINRAKSIEQGKRIIPVVVHVIHEMGNENIPVSDIQNALDALNKNINGQSDKFLDKYQNQFPLTPDVFAAVRGEANVEFRLAKLDPQGNPTNGVLRVQSDFTNGTDPNNLVKTLSYWNSYQYFNIWVVRTINSGDGGITLGYAQFPQGGFMSTDGVVILWNEMNDPQSTTLTHEAGHWLGLCHTWDCGGGSCGTDNVLDTPPQHTSNGFTTDPGADPGVPDPSKFPWHVGVPSGVIYGCEADSLNWAGEMYMNYMDYTNDNFCTMFSKGQVEVMNETLEGDTADFGFRIHIWSDDNIAATGTIDGFLSPSCDKEVSFDEDLSHYTICVGSPSVLKGNKSIFGNNITKWEWDFGDGNTDVTGNNSPQHTYAVEGSYNLSLKVEYSETTEAKAYNLSDLDLTNASSYDSIISTLIVQGTQAELNTMGASNISPHTIDSLGVYYDMQDSTFYRGELDETIYVAYYINSCSSTITKSNFITVMPSVGSNNASSYNYSFENASELGTDWIINASVDGENIWNFTTFEDKTWENTNRAASEGNSSVMMPAKDGAILSTSSISSAAYDLSGLTNPAIKFSWAGAAANTSPVNELNVYYSDNCGWSWKSLGSLTPYQVASAGLYNSSFMPKNYEWNDSIMYDRIGTNALKSENIRFKFEYVTNGSSNNFYLDNIQIGEESSLLQNVNENNARLEIFPNPTNGEATIVLENLNDMNVQVELVNILGAEVMLLYTGTVVNKYHAIDANLSNLENGIYFVNVFSDGKSVVTDKIILYSK
ncbi:MAG: T9SS type A sorting domain-containing protein [Flavobacteriales bacterium]|nr:T9SS type A sorting domain-containing protein [Flavobacteriales bacterium]